MKTRPTNRRPLTPEELPELLKSSFNFSTQDVEYNAKRKSWSMTIERTCYKCHTSKRILVSAVRSGLRLNNLTGVCKKCLRTIIIPKQQKGAKNYNWKGGRRKTPAGYILIRSTEHPSARNGYVFEHRLVMEEKLGRHLNSLETVHHKNGVKDDNRIENLELWTASHGNGSRYIDMTVAQLEELTNYLQELIKTKKR